MILMDEIMQNPESPQSEFVNRVETRALREIRSLLKDDDEETRLDQVVQYVEENSHPCLWRILAQAALNRLDLTVAESALQRLCWGECINK